MSLKISNTITGNKEEFNPIEPGKVGMYVCGVTVYDHCHIGHARAAVVFDVVYRYLKYSGYDVTYVRNFTDIDDKIIAKANAEDLPAKEITERYISAFYEDMDALGVERPEIEPRATDHVTEMIDHVEKLIEQGYAYPVEGDVYFSVESYPAYGRLSQRPLDEMVSGARVDVDDRKKSPLDFALWKAAKPGEPSWDSPWGPGRPGWHIECTVMGQKYLGKTLDIHGGGKDLVFPHHENEVAQAEAVSDAPFVNYWMHNGFVNINHEKMSKSLGNFFTIRDVLERIHPEVLRLFLLSHHYRSPLDYAEESLRDAAASMDRLYAQLQRIDELLGDGEHSPKVECEELSNGARAVHEAVLELYHQFDIAMNDDFNTAEAIGHLNKCSRQIGAFLHTGVEPNPANLSVLNYARSSFAKIGDVLGLFQLKPVEYFAAKKRGVLEELSLDEARIDELVAERAQARADRNWGRADEIRDELAAMNVVLKDGPEGTQWSVEGN